MSSSGWTIRPARREDADGFLALVRALAEFERLPGPTDEAAARLVEDAFGQAPRFELLVAQAAPDTTRLADARTEPQAAPDTTRLADARTEPQPIGEPGRIVAYAVFFPTYSTFLARPTLFLEDIFVHPDARGRGLAEEILRRLAALAIERGCGRFEWMVLDWNEPAQRLYRRIGARHLDTWQLFRLEGEEALGALAGARVRGC
jgi:GNAT superfamily N-acetyltransferase